jgi:hypothetical protein
MRMSSSTMAANIKDLNSLKIRFKSSEAELKGFEVLLKSGMPTRAVADDKYIINELQCRMLKSNDIDYEKVE